MRAGKVILLIFGLLGIVASTGFLFGGGGIFLADATIKDNAGYYSTKTIQVERGSYAVVTGPADIHLDNGWDWGDLASFKATGSSSETSGDIFIGVAETDDVEDYLSGVDYDEVTDFSMFPANVSYRNHAGTAVPDSPTAQSFWVAAVHGSGTQTLEWDMESGRYSLVLMNSDGSKGVDLEVVLGMKVPWLTGIGFGIIFMGVLGLIISGIMIFFAVRSPRNQDNPPPANPSQAESENSAAENNIENTDVPDGKTSLGLDPNVAGLLCYLFGWISGIIIFILEKENKFVRFHALQSIIVFGFLTIAGTVLGAWPFFGKLLEAGIGIITLVFWIVLMVKAYQGEKYKMPLAGDFAEKQAG